MHFKDPLTEGILLRRYKRFLSDIKLLDGSTITAHCPNTGSMLSCSTPGSSVFLSHSDNTARKYPHTLEMIKVGPTWVGVNTARTNGLVMEAIRSGCISEFAGADGIYPERKTSSHNRLDLMVSHAGCTSYIEVKSCSLAVDGCAMFPDAVTTRGAKHLQELTRLAQEGFGAAIFFLVQRMDADHFAPATHIDPVYGKALLQAKASGVRVLVYQAEVSPEGIQIVNGLPFVLKNPCG